MGSAEEVKRNKRCLGFNGTKLCSYPNESQVWPCSEIAQPSHNALIITKHSGKSCAGTADLSKPLAHPVNTFTLTEATNASYPPPHTHAGSSLQPNAHMSKCQSLQCHSLPPPPEAMWRPAGLENSPTDDDWCFPFSSKETIGCTVYITVQSRSFSSLRAPHKRAKWQRLLTKGLRGSCLTCPKINNMFLCRLVRDV